MILIGKKTIANVFLYLFTYFQSTLFHIYFKLAPKDVYFILYKYDDYILQLAKNYIDIYAFKYVNSI